VPKKPLALPAFKGSWLRGILGVELKRSVCLFPDHILCNQCEVVSSCGFPLLYGEGVSGTNGAPPLYIIRLSKTESNFSTDRNCSIETPLKFGISLIGPATSWALQIVIALKKALFARHINLQSVISEDTLIFSSDGGGEWKWTPPTIQFLPFPELIPNASHKTINTDKISSDEGPLQYTINFISPFRVKANGSLVNGSNLSLPILVSAMERRLSTTWKVATNVTPARELFNDIKLAAQSAVPTLKSLTWHEERRFSHRQKTGMNLGGIYGTVSYLLPSQIFSQAFDNLFTVASKLHIGKQVSFGLGSFSFSKITHLIA
jgi:hypothetical protein